MSNLTITEKKEKQHYVKSVRIRRYSGPHFPAFGMNTFAHFLKLFILKLKLRRKSSNLLLRVTLTSHKLLAFKTSNKFYCAQAAKIIIENQISLTLTTNFDLFFKYYFSTSLKTKSEDQVAQNQFIFNLFNSFGLTGFVVVLFCWR